MTDGLLERRGLRLRFLDERDGSQGALRKAGWEWVARQAQDALLDVGGEAQEHHDLRDPGPGEAFASGDGGLAGDFTSVELASPLASLKERADDWRDLGAFRWFAEPRLASALGDGANHAVGRHLARQGADIAVLESSIRSKSDFNSLLAEFERTLDVVGSDVDNTKPDLRDGPSGLTEGTPGSQTENRERFAAWTLTESPEVTRLGAFAVSAVRQRLTALSAFPTCALGSKPSGSGFARNPRGCTRGPNETAQNSRALWLTCRVS